jgi:hypothetical protein
MSSLKNALLTRYDSGFRTDTDSSSISANGRREAFVALSNVRSNANSDTIVAAYLAAFKAGVTTVTADVVPTTTAQTPYVGGWAAGASVTVPRPSNSGTGEVMQVRAITVTENQDGELSFTPELIRAEESRSLLVNQQLQRLGNGTLNGRVNNAVVASDVDPDVSAGRVEMSEQQFSKDTLAVEISPYFTPSDYYRIEDVWVSLKEPGTTATTLQVLVDGTAQQFKIAGASASTTITIPAGIYTVYGYITSQKTIAPTSNMQVSVTAAGTGAVGLNAKLRLGAQ